MNEISFAELKTTKKKCLAFSNVGNKVVSRQKALYQLEAITGDRAHRKIYLEVSKKDEDYPSYILYDDLGIICISATVSFTDLQLDKLTAQIADYPFWGIEGLIKRLEESEKNQYFINLIDIEALKLTGNEALVEHYAKYRNHMIEVRQERGEQRLEAQRIKEQEEKERLQNQIDQELESVKNAIRNKEMVYNRELKINQYGKNPSIILYLMKQYGINIPLKTQGWINQGLCKVMYKENEITYAYYKTSRDSTVFYNYLRELENKIAEEQGIGLHSTIEAQVI